MVEVPKAEHKESPSETPPIIIKIGGNTLLEETTIIGDIATLHGNGRPLIVVHGGGHTIDYKLRKRKIDPKKIDGVRVTDKPTLEVVIGALAEINKQLVEKLLALGVNAFGLTGKEIRLLKADMENPKLGFVGRVRKVNRAFLKDKIGQGFVPVISPVAYTIINGSIQLLNVNSDLVAGRIASAFPGSQLLLLTDVEGVKDQNGNIIQELDMAQYGNMAVKRVIRDGMIPKIDAAFDALSHRSVPRIISGKKPHAMLDALGGKSIGTSFID
ncbi:MAG: acetylglutamate kinase [Patescibacteria group bacterium]